FYNLVNEGGESYTLYTSSGAPREAFATFLVPRATELFGPTFRGEGVVRIGDVRKDPRYGRVGPHHGMPKGHLPVRSYLAVPVTSRDGRVLGGLFYGHPEPDRFTKEAEEVLSTLAAQTALALDNADLHKALQRELEQQRLAQTALGESEKRYRQLLTNLPVAVFTCDADGRILLYNEAAVALWGRVPDLTKGVWQGAHKLYATDGTPLAQKDSPMARAVREGISIRGEEMIIERPDGTRRRVLVHPEPLRDPSGRIIGGHNVLVDITERTESEHRLDLATKVGKLGIWDWDIAGNTINWTDAVYAIHGVKKGAFQPTMEGYQQLIHPEDRERVGHAIRATLEQEAPYEIEFRTLNEEGTVNWVYTSGVVLRESGRPMRMMGGTMNITERKQAEETLRTSEERFRLLADNMDQLAWMADADGSTIWFNSRWEEFSGIPLNEIRERAATDLHHPDHYERVTASLREAAAKGENWGGTFPLKGRDGQWHWFLSRVMALKDDEGKVYRWFGTSTDVTAEREAQEQLRESEGRFRLLGDTMAQLAWIGDADGVPIWYNKQWELFTGIDMINSPLEEWAQLVHPDHGARIRASHEKGVAAGVTWEETFPLRGIDGQYRWFLSRSIPVRDENGVVIRWFGTNTDITEREAGAEAAQRLAAIVQSSTDAIISKDLNSIITSWNAGAVGVFGYTAAEAIGRSVMMLIPPERSQEEGSILDRIRRGEHIDHYTTVRVRKDGTRIDVSLTVSPIRDNEGRIVGASKIARDISENKRLLDAMHAANEQLQMVTDNMPVAVARLSRDQHYVWASQGYLGWIGLPVAAVEGRPIPEVIGEEAYGAIKAHVDKVLLGERVEYEAQVDLSSRGKRWINAIYAPLYRSGSEAEGWIEVITDITRRKELEEALQDADRHKDHFLATLAHELRNPLAPLKSGIQLLELGADDPELGRTTQAMMARQIDHMVRLVDDLMDLSRISRGKIDLRKEEVDLAMIIATAMETSGPLIDQREHRFEVDIPDGDWYVNGDADRLTQVISNLLNNAAKYTQPGGRLELSLERDGDEAVIHVKDNGIGIDAGALPMVFDMFAQVDMESRSMATGGLGIGLNIVKRLVEMHKGSVEGRSEGRGKGSEFILRLPLTKRTEKSRALPLERTTNTPGEVKRVLVVDDNQDAAVTMSMILRKRGHVVEVAHDGEEAIARAGSFRPEVIFMDIGMPRMNGYEACKAIRQFPEGKNITIVALSGWGQEEDRRRSEEAGFDRHLVKPIDGNTLQSVIMGANSMG
ncbi:MAG: PAS domain S-box protein, partial [Flavobacteriales bacterium]